MFKLNRIPRLGKIELKAFVTSLLHWLLKLPPWKTCNNCVIGMHKTKLYFPWEMFNVFIVNSSLFMWMILHLLLWCTRYHVSLRYHIWLFTIPELKNIFFNALNVCCGEINLLSVVIFNNKHFESKFVHYFCFLSCKWTFWLKVCTLPYEEMS